MPEAGPLDYYWFISENLLNGLETYMILPRLHSDHSNIKINRENEYHYRRNAYGNL